MKIKIAEHKEGFSIVFKGIRGGKTVALETVVPAELDYDYFLKILETASNEVTNYQYRVQCAVHGEEIIVAKNIEGLMDRIKTLTDCKIDIDSIEQKDWK